MRAETGGALAPAGVRARAPSAAQVDRSIPFVDTHHHLWELHRLRYAWLEGDGDTAETAILGEYRMLRSDWGPARFVRELYGQNVVGSIHVEAAMSGPDPVAETRWMDGVSATYGFPSALVVHCDLTDPNAAHELDRHLAASPLVRGVRMRSQPADDATTAFRTGLAALVERGLCYELSPGDGELPVALRLARRHPDLLITLGHAGAPPTRGHDAFVRWERDIRSLAQAPNVVCKVSGLGMSDHGWTIASIRPWVLACIQAFGTQRTVFGTNWPVDLLYAPYVEQVDAYRVILADAGLPRDDQAAMLHRNAERIYRLAPRA